MNIKDIITLVRAGYTKDEINQIIAAAEKAEVLNAQPSAPIDMPDAAADPVPAAAEAPAENPRIAALEAQVKELQGKLIQLTTVNTIPAEVLNAQPSAPIDMQDAAAAEDPRIAALEAQVKELQGKLIQLTTVNTIPAEHDVMLDIGNTLINGGKIK